MERKRKAIFVLAVCYAAYDTLLTAEHIVSGAAAARFAVAVFLIDFLLERLVGLVSRTRDLEDNAPKRRALVQNNSGQRWSGRRFFLVVWALILLWDILIWLGLFPGIFGYDSYVQMAFYTGLEPWNTHHPVLHTWLLGSLLSLGRTLGWDYNAGVALYIFLQLLLASSACAFALWYLRRQGVRRGWLIVLAAYLLLHPALALLLVNTTKDSLFGIFFLYFMVSALLLLERGERRRRYELIFGVSGLLCCLLRNQGIYVMLALALLAAAAHLGCAAARRREMNLSAGSVRWGRLAGALLGIVAVTVCVQSVFTGILHIQKGEIREMLSVPMQQAAAVLAADEVGEAVLTGEQHSIARTLITEEMTAVYTPETADPVKGLFRSEVFSANKGVYLKNYAVLGLQNHGLYADAWAAMIRPYWDMSKNPYRGLMAAIPGWSEELWGIRESAVLPGLGDLIKALAIWDDYRWIPLLSRVFDPALYIWAVTAVLVAAVARRRWESVAACLPGLLYFCTLLLGPVALVRYLYPLLLTLPLLAGTLLSPDRETGDAKKLEFP